MLEFKFNWIIHDKLAYGNQPGLYNNLFNDLLILEKNNISMIVSLIENNIYSNLKDLEFKIIHFPINDMGISTPREVFRICKEIDEHLKLLGNKVFVHCKAGLGRTGTILAAYFINLYNINHEEAIKKVRSIDKFFIQNKTQEKFIEHYYNFFTENKTIYDTWN